MLPISTKEPVQFTPPYYLEGDDEELKAAAPVYLVEVPSLLRKTELQRDVAMAGGKHRTAEELRILLRECIEDVVHEDDRGALIEAIDYFEALLAEDNPSAEALKAAVREVDMIEASMIEHHPEYRTALAQQRYVMQMMPIIACQMFLIGVDGKPPLERKFGKLTEAALNTLPDRDVLAIGTHAFKLSHLDKDQEKNSGSPSTTQPSPTSSGHTAKSRRTAKAGKSTAKPT